MHLMRCLFFFVAHFQLVLAPAHIPGKQNVAADHLSRDALALLLSRSSVQSARLDVGGLEERAAFYFPKGLAVSSQKTSDRTPLPASEAMRCKFVSLLASEGLKHRIYD